MLKKSLGLLGVLLMAFSSLAAAAGVSSLRNAEPQAPSQAGGTSDFYNYRHPGQAAPQGNGQNSEVILQIPQTKMQKPEMTVQMPQGNAQGSEVIVQAPAAQNPEISVRMSEGKLPNIDESMRRADAEQIAREQNMTQIRIAKGLELKLPNGQTTVIVEILPNGDIKLENGLDLTSDGYALAGEFAGQRIVAPLEPETAQAGAAEPAAEAAQIPGDKIAEMLTTLPGMKKGEQAAPKQGPAKKEAGKKDAAKKAAQKPAQSNRMYIPPEEAKKRSVAFMDGCWKGGSVDYHTKRKLGTCFCFKGGQGQEKVYDPGHFGTTQGAAWAKILSDEQLLIHSAPRKKPSGQTVWLEQDMICRNKGKTAFCTEKFVTGQQQSFETSFERVSTCP